MVIDSDDGYLLRISDSRDADGWIIVRGYVKGLLLECIFAKWKDLDLCIEDKTPLDADERTRAIADAAIDEVRIQHVANLRGLR